MKTQTRILALLFALCSFTIFTNAQDFEVPVDVTLDAKEDYTKYEKDVIAATDWPEATPIKNDDSKRKKVSAFVFQWISGSPTVSISLDAGIAKLSDKNPELLMMLMAGYSRYALQNGYEKDQLKCFTAAMKSVINLYKKGGDVKKNKTVEKAIEADNEGKLTDWVGSNFIKSK
jgi:hypothetical protein